MNAPERITHEAEVQRQHARMRTEMRVEINGYELQTLDWSVGGFAVETDRAMGLSAPADVVLFFTFDSFSLALPLKAVMRHETPIATGGVRTGFEFVDLTRDQVATLRYVAGAFLSGEIVRSGDLFATVNRDNSAKLRKKEPPHATAAERFSLARMMSFGIAAVFVVGILGLLSLMVFERAYLIPATSAKATIAATTVRAPQAGVLVFTGAQAGERLTAGTPMLGIETADGTVHYMDSPCDCEVLAVSAVAGLFVPGGEPLFEIIAPGEEVRVTALFEPKAVADISGDESVSVRILGDDQVRTARILSSNLDSSSGKVALTIQPEQALELSAIGQAATVTLNKAPAFLTSAVAAIPSE